MDKNRIEDLAGDPRFIPGIYNYCDQWCERCAFTSRCTNYAMGQEESGILRLLAILKRLLGQAETAFPNARAFLRPGFDAADFH